MQALETCDESVAKPWRDLKEQQQRLVAYITDLQRRLTNFSEAPVVREIRNLETVYAGFERGVLAERENIQWRRSALTNARAAAEVTYRRKRREELLAKMTQASEVPAVVIENQRHLVWLCTAPIAELEESLKYRELELAFCRQQSENAAEEYRAEKRACKAELKAAEKQLAQIIEAQRHWVSTDRKRLAWFLSQHPHRRNEMIQAYRLAHPEDALCDLIPAEEQTGWSPPSARPALRKRRRTSNGDAGAGPAAPAPAAAADERLWTLVYTHDSSTVEYPIAQKRKQAVSTLGTLLQEQRLAVSPALLLEKLTTVTRLSVQQRQGLKRVRGQDLHGRKILRVGEYRALLDINEEQRIIRFLVRPRKESYDR